MKHTSHTEIAAGVVGATAHGCALVMLALLATRGLAVTRVGAVVGALMISLPYVVATVMLHRTETGEPLHATTWGRSASRAWALLAPLLIALTLYVAVLFYAFGYPGHGIAGGGYTLASVGTMAVIVGAGSRVRLLTRSVGVEREAFLRAAAASGAFLVLAAFGYGLFQSFLGLPHPSAWWVYGSGLTVFVTTLAVQLTRRTS